MKLALFSGDGGRKNAPMSREAGDLLQRDGKTRVTFVPWSTDDAAGDFREFRRMLDKAGISDFEVCAIDKGISRSERAALLRSDMIFLGGGNTFYFLHHLRACGLLAPLRTFARSGKVLMGLSAGSILMTPNIVTAEVPGIDADENEVGLRDYGALGLVQFEFSPHYCRSRRADRDLLEHSLKVARPIYACADGGGIIVDGASTRFVGVVHVFHRGHKYCLQ